MRKLDFLVRITGDDLLGVLGAAESCRGGTFADWMHGRLVWRVFGKVFERDKRG